MKILHLADSKTMLKHGNNFQTGHYLNLPDGKVISIGEIADVYEAAFVADGAIPLPHMLSPETIGPEVAASLAHLGIKAEHKTFDAMLQLRKIHPAFSPNSF
jgi:hypothetical protein